MPRINFDTANAEAAQNERPRYLEPGTHTLTVTGWEYGATASGTGFMQVTARTESGQAHRERLFLSPKAQWRIVAFLAAVGLKLSGEVDLSEISDLLTGRDFTADFDKNDRGYLEVKKFHAASKIETVAVKNAAPTGDDDDVPF